MSDGDTQLTARDSIIAGSTSVDHNGNCKHDSVLNEYSEVIATTMTNNLHLAKNIVNPMVQEVIEFTERYVSAEKEISANYTSVVPVFHNKIWESSTLLEMVGKYADTPFEEVRLTIGIPHSTTIPDLLALTKTGAEGFDRELALFFGSMHDDKIINSFLSVFGPISVDRKQILSDVISSKEKDVLVFSTHVC